MGPNFAAVKNNAPIVSESKSLDKTTHILSSTFESNLFILKCEYVQCSSNDFNLL